MYINERCKLAVLKYLKIAQKASLSLTTLALAFVNSRWFTASTIIGVTTLDQLKEDIDAFLVTVSPAVLQEINEVHMDCRDPSQN